MSTPVLPSHLGFTGEKETAYGVVFHQVKAIKDIDRWFIKAGGVGGWVADGVVIGEGSWVGSGSYLFPGTIIGNDTIIGDGTHIGDHTEIGDRTRIGNGTIIGDGTHIGDYTRIGYGTSIGYDTIIGDGTHIGDHTEIGDRTRIGDYIIIGVRAHIGEDAEILNPHHLFTISPIGLENKTLTLHRTSGGGHKIAVGCWYWHTIDDLAEEVESRAKKWDATPEQIESWKADYADAERICRRRISSWEREK